MAKAPEKTDNKAAPKKSLKVQSMILCIIMAICAVRFMPTTLIVVVGMIPTAVAYFVDDSRDKSLGPVVLWLNFAGVLPALLKLWHDGNTMANSMDIITQPFMLAMMLFPAACGWMLYAYVPYLVIGVVRRKAEARIKTLEKYQQDLVGQWGVVVGGAQLKAETADAVEATNLKA